MSTCLHLADRHEPDVRAHRPGRARRTPPAFEPGDRIVSIDGTAITSWDQSTAIIQKSADQALTVVVERDGTRHTVTVTPATDDEVRDERAGRGA